MKTFEINLVGENISIQPNSNGTFTAFKDGKQLAVLCPDITKEIGTRWSPCDGINPELAEQIGELIEEHEM